MSGWRYNAEIRSIFWVKEFATEVLRHPLNFKTQQPEILHHLRHARRNQAEVFPADEHVRNTSQCRKFLHSLSQPEIVLSAKKIIDVQISEPPLHIAWKIFERAGILDRKPKMKLLAIRTLH